VREEEKRHGPHFHKKPKCKRGETKLSWNSQGVPGNSGAKGVNGVNGTNGKEGATGKEGKAGPTGPAGVAPNVFVGNKELKSGIANLMSVAVPPGSAAGVSVSYTILATDGGSQAVTETGVIYWNALSNAITCKTDKEAKLSLGTVNSSCVLGFFEPGFQPGLSIFDSPSFSSPAPVVVNHVWFTITNNSGAALTLQ
jgi:Collagen triple helix repeat (20 copies)